MRCGRSKESLLNPDSRGNKIGLMGPFSLGNLGNAALQQTVVEHLNKRFPDAEFYGCCIEPGELANGHQIVPSQVFLQNRLSLAAHRSFS